MELAFTILNSLGLGGVAIYLYFVLNGLKEKINTLQGTINAQKDTLEAVRERADEFNRLSKGYKQALDDFEQMGKKLDQRRQELVKELEEANQRKDEKLIEFRNLELKEIELKQKSLEALPEIESRLAQVVSDLDSKIKILAPSAKPSSSLSPGLLALLAGPPHSRSTLTPTISSVLASMRYRQLLESLGQTSSPKSTEDAGSAQEPESDESHGEDEKKEG